MYLVTHLTLIQELNQVVKKCEVTARELWSYSNTASQRIEVMCPLYKFELLSMREAPGWMGKQYTDYWGIRIDRHLRATNRGYARLVFDPGGTHSTTLMVTTFEEKSIITEWNVNHLSLHSHVSRAGSCPRE